MTQIKIWIGESRAVHVAAPVTEGQLFAPACNPSNNFGVAGYGGESKWFYRAPEHVRVTCKRCLRITG